MTDRKEPTLNQILRALFHVHPISKPIMTTIINTYCSPIPPDLRAILAEVPDVIPMGVYDGQIICIDQGMFIAISPEDITT